MQISRFWGGAGEQELVEGIPVLVETCSEDLGMDLFELFHGFAGLEKIKACLLGESLGSWG